MKSLILSVLVLAQFGTVRAALADLDVAEGSISSPDGVFVGRDFKVADGFKLELLHLPPASQQGRWVAMSWDAKGRLLVPSYDSDLLTRLTIPRVGSADPVKVEMIDTTRVGAAEGVLDAFDSIYLNVNRSQTMRAGLYRLRDTNNDGRLDETRIIHARQAGGDHGTHTILLNPDGKMISQITGNTAAPTDVTRSRVPSYGADNLVLRLQSPSPQWKMPGGHVVNYSPDGSVVELWAVGMRNPVSHAFNKDGEMFIYDSDDESSQGNGAIYRPTAVYHLQSGADVGHRGAGRVHPFWYLDDVGTVAVVGGGSPTGSTFGTKAKFPARYQDALFICDWSFGMLHAVYLTPTGGSYKGEVKPFISGRPFAVSNAIINPADGSMLVQTTGTELYRVTYVGDESTEATKPDPLFAPARETRRQLERFHGNKVAGAVAEAWPYLGHADRSIRYAARLAVESQDVATWRERALDEKDPRRAIAAIAALARASGLDVFHTPPSMAPTRDPALTKRMLATLNRIGWDTLAYNDKLDLLRAYGLTFIRLGPPDAEDTQRLIARLDPHLPAGQQELNLELAEMLVYLQAPSAATKVMALLRAAPSAPYYGIQEWINPQQRQRQDRGVTSGANLGISQAAVARQEEQHLYAQLLRTLKTGWTLELRKEFFEWWSTGIADRLGGSQNYLEIMRIDAVSTLSPEEKAALGDLVTKPVPPARAIIRPTAGAAAPVATPAGGAAGGGGRGGGAQAGTPGLGAPASSFYIAPYQGRQFTDTELTLMSRFDESMEKQVKDVADATKALAAATLTPSANSATIGARVDTLGRAELALALARAAGYSKLKADLKIAPERVPALITALNNPGSTGGGGGRGAAPLAPVAPRGGN